MQAISQTFHSAESENLPSTSVKTTLYELIEAISEEVPPEEDDLVTEVVLHLFDSGKIKSMVT